VDIAIKVNLEKTLSNIAERYCNNSPVYWQHVSCAATEGSLGSFSADPRI